MPGTPRLRIVSKGIAIIVLGLSLLSPAAYGAEENAEKGKAKLLANLARQVLGCSIHPCFHDDAATTLAGKLVTDGTFYYSSISDAFPQTGGALQGVVEWDSDSGPITAIYFIVIDFPIAPRLLLGELEAVLPGCEMEKDDDAGRAWSCMYGPNDVLVEAFFGAGVVLLQLG